MNHPSVKLCRRKQTHAGFAVAPQTIKVMATVCDKCLVKTKEALNLHNKVCCYNSYILSLVTVNLLLCLTNFITDFTQGSVLSCTVLDIPQQAVEPIPCGKVGTLDFPCGSAGKESCNVGNLGSIPGLGRSPGEGK